MRKSFFIAPFIGLLIGASFVQASSFNDVYQQVFSDPYDVLPFYKVDSRHFGKPGDHPDNHVLQAGIRSLTLEQDLYDFPNKQKLFQANGICFAGIWQIDEASDFTGLFAKSSIQVPVIARASVALNGTLRKHKRAFGMAIKLFPSAQSDQPVNTQNLFVMHSLGGVKTDHVLDLVLDNQPALGSIPPLGQLRKALRLRKDFERADRQVGGEHAEVNFRPVDHLAAVTSSATKVEQPIAPTWVRLRADADLPRMDQDDFRHELKAEQYPNGQLIWHIEVAEGEEKEKKEQKAKKQAQWRTLGKLILDQSITSATCDQRLHFRHPIIE